VQQQNDNSFEYVRNLETLSPSALIYELKDMDLSSADEQARLCEYVRERVPAARAVDTSELLRMISGYPGVVSFWLRATLLGSLQTLGDLKETAKNAKNLRYTELDRLFNRPLDEKTKFIARLVSLPQLDRQAWRTLQPVLITGAGIELLQDLTTEGVLDEEADFPTFGHDTRHVALRHLFAKKSRIYFTSIAQDLICALAAECTTIDYALLPFFGGLAAATELLQVMELDEASKCFIYAARSAFNETDGFADSRLDASYLTGLSSRNPRAAPLLCIAVLNRGITRGRTGDVPGELADYSALITLPRARVDQVAKALFNRGFARGEQGGVPNARALHSTRPDRMPFGAKVGRWQRVLAATLKPAALEGLRLRCPSVVSRSRERRATFPEVLRRTIPAWNAAPAAARQSQPQSRRARGRRSASETRPEQRTHPRR
jgi:hypothetical protein